MTNYTPMPTRRPASSKTYPICSLKKAMDIIDKKCGDVYIMEKHGKGLNKVIFLPEATRELSVMLSYGRPSPMNVNELKLQGYGQTFLLDDECHTLTIVAHFIEVPTNNRSATSAGNLGVNGENNPGLDILEYKRKEYLKGEYDFNIDEYGHQINPFLKFGGPSKFILEGHTHPNLGVFFSGPDKESGAARAASSPVCIFVCDPIRKKMLAAIGKSFAEAEIIVYSRGTTPQEDLSEDKGLIPPTDEIARLASQCLRLHGYTGDIRFRTRIDGRGCLKIKLVIPKSRKE